MSDAIVGQVVPGQPSELSSESLAEQPAPEQRPVADASAPVAMRPKIGDSRPAPPFMSCWTKFLLAPFPGVSSTSSKPIPPAG